jgi:hypothetical protein
MSIFDDIVDFIGDVVSVPGDLAEAAASLFL